MQGGEDLGGGKGEGGPLAHWGQGADVLRRKKRKGSIQIKEKEKEWFIGRGIVENRKPSRG